MLDNTLTVDEWATIQTALVVDEDGNPVVDETLVDDVVIDKGVVDEGADDSVVVEEPSGEEEVADGSVEEQTDGSDSPTMWVSEDGTVYAFRGAEIEGGDEEPVGEDGVIEEDGIVGEDGGLVEEVEVVVCEFFVGEEFENPEGAVYGEITGADGTESGDDGVVNDDDYIFWSFASDGEDGEADGGDGTSDGGEAEGGDGVVYDDEFIYWTFTSDGEGGESGDGALEGDNNFDPQILYMSAGGGAGPNVMGGGPLSNGADFEQPVYDSFREEAAVVHFSGADYCFF